LDYVQIKNDKADFSALFYIFGVVMSDDIFVKKMQDVIRLSEKYHIPKFSRFLDSREQITLKSAVPNCNLFGGYQDAERQIFGVFPDWQEADCENFPIAAIKFHIKFSKELTHRHFLGTILSLGIERDKVGDILVGENDAYAFVTEDIAEFVASNIGKIAGVGVDTSIIPIDEVVLPEKKFEVIDAVCASQRLDAVVSGLYNKSRNEAKNLILAGKVFVNHFEAIKTDFLVNEEDLISIRGFGRAVVLDIGNKTRSDRIHITFKKYI